MLTDRWKIETPNQNTLWETLGLRLDAALYGKTQRLFNALLQMID